MRTRDWEAVVRDVQARNARLLEQRRALLDDTAAILTDRRKLLRQSAPPRDVESTEFFLGFNTDPMTQADIQQGRLVCAVGVAPVRPAEFVQFRISRYTADVPR